MNFDFLPHVSHPPTMFGDLTVEELEILWEKLSHCPALWLKVYGTGNVGVRSDVSSIFWEVAVELDFRELRGWGKFIPIGSPLQLQYPVRKTRELVRDIHVQFIIIYVPEKPF